MAAALAIEWWWLPPEGYPERYGYTGDQYQPIGSLFIQAIIAGWVWFRSWFDRDTITTLAIVATAIFTGTLWRATDRLWRISNIHAGHMEQSTIVAERSVQAATVVAEAAKATVQAAVDQVEIARKAFLLTHRPRIRVIHLSLGKGGRDPRPIFQSGSPIHGRIGIRNIGEGDATLWALTFRIFVTDGGQPDRWPVNPKAIYDFRPHQRTLSPGYGTIIDVEDAPANDLIIDFARNCEIYFFGRISYFFGEPEIIRSTSFCRMCALPQGRRSPRLLKVDDSELEYEE